MLDELCRIVEEATEVEVHQVDGLDAFELDTRFVVEAGSRVHAELMLPLCAIQDMRHLQKSQLVQVSGGFPEYERAKIGYCLINCVPNAIFFVSRGMSFIKILFRFRKGMLSEIISLSIISLIDKISINHQFDRYDFYINLLFDGF